MDFTTITLGAAAKAMNDVVIPAAVNSGHAQAVEQAHLVRDAIVFAQSRIELIGDRRQFDLHTVTELLEGLLTDDDVATLPVAERLSDTVQASRDVLFNPSSAGRIFAAALYQSNETLTALLEEVDCFDPATRSRIEKIVHAYAMQRLEFDRSWLSPLGFDPEPATVRHVDVLLAENW